MAEITITRCDLCGADGAMNVQIYTTEHGEWAVDVCEPCLAPLIAQRPRNHRFRKIALPPQPD